jgi:tRNA 2-thiouridine synthesizing protein D
VAQKPHANAVHGRTVEEENHFIPKDAIAALMRSAERNGGKIDWVNCGLCVDERGAANTLVIATR